MKRYLLWIFLGTSAGLILAAAVYFTRPYNLHGSVIQQAYAAPDFSLPQAQGGDFQLGAQKGKVVLVFFGYTYCPDVCPTTLSVFKQVRKNLGANVDHVQFVFITVDPDRDTPARMAEYVHTFDPAFIGLSGSQSQLDSVWQSYGVYHKLNKKSADDQFYEVEHSTQVYLIDKSGNLRVTYPFGTQAEDMLQDVEYLLRQ